MSARDVLPNVIFVLKVLPKRVIIFHTDWEVSREKARYQEQIFGRKGIEALSIEIPAYDYRRIREILENSRQKSIINPKEAHFLTNAATKYTVEVIHNWIEENGGTSLYYMPDGTVAKFGGEHLFRIESDVLEPEDFLNLGGFSLRNQVKFEEKLKGRAHALLEFYLQLIEEGKFCEPSEDDVEWITRRERRILGNPYNWLYRNSRERFGTAGYPLEFLTYMVLLQSGRFNHVLANVEIYREQEIRNEVDVVAVQRNTLFYFSCKRSRKRGLEEHFFRVGSLSRRLGGRFSVPVVITCRDKEVERKKAAMFGVNVIRPEELVRRMEKEPDHLIEEWKRVAFSYM